MCIHTPCCLPVRVRVQERATALSAKDVALDTFARRAEQLGVTPHLPPSAAASGALRFGLWQCDHANNVTGAAARGSRQLKVVKLSLAGLLGPGRTPLGGLVYAGGSYVRVRIQTRTCACACVMHPWCLLLRLSCARPGLA